MNDKRQTSKRHPGLQPFSRDHHHGLVQVQRLRKAAKRETPVRRQAADDFQLAWQNDIQTHFEQEEAYLLAYMNEDHRKRLLHEHTRLRQLAHTLQTNPSPEMLLDLSQCLKAHIRWEENELFPELERTMPESDLLAIQKKLNR